MANLNNIGGIHYEMMRRCYDKKSVTYKHYGDKGITVCNEWHDRENFRKWAIENGYVKGLRLERIDTKGNYEPANCRFGENNKKKVGGESQYHKNIRKHRLKMIKECGLDDFCCSAMQQGLEYHVSSGRGLIPAGLMEEIRALSMPPIPWDVAPAKWFDIYFAPLEKHRTYYRPSRRQASTPDIPRPSYHTADIPVDSRTFGVVIDTSGSMDAQKIGKALGSVASYSIAHDVPFARVNFCDAAAYGAGYISPEDIAGRVCIKGRGGTVLQPGIDALESAKDFPADGPILIITDGEIEDHLDIKHEHAYLLPKGARLPYKAKGEVFYFDD